ncbi:hypothetical protein QW180_31255 [Vibrio sinaloensis]|nr:hypothetical protein [Vibrio sinaloensis]
MNTTLNWILLLVTVAVMVGLAVYSNKIMKSDEGEGGFLLAANCLGPFTGAATIVATGFSGWGFMGSPGVAYKYGAIELLGNFFFAPAMVLAVIFCARFFAPESPSDGQPNHTGIHCQKNHQGPDSVKRLTQAVAALITIVLLLVFFLIGQVKALGLLAGQWLGISPTTASLIMVGIIILYTSIGGLAAVAFTDTVMVIGMCVSAAIIAMTVFTDISPSELVDALHTIDPSLVEPDNSGPYGASTWHVFFWCFRTHLSTLPPYLICR